MIRHSDGKVVEGGDIPGASIQCSAQGGEKGKDDIEGREVALVHSRKCCDSRARGGRWPGH